jgi:tRNA A-37 threonylcarbamoyl transferase component Bud32
MDESPADRTSLAAQIGAKLGSPLVLAVSVVVLVSAVGSAATYSSYHALCRLSRAEAQARLRADSGRLETSVGGALQVADELLDRLAAHVRAQGPSPAADTLLGAMYDLGSARTGLTWMSANYPDGTFVGIYRDGRLWGQESRVGPEGGTERKFALAPPAAPRQVEQRATGYDPRTRSFYRLAVAKRRRVWAPPYPFLPSLRTGISRVEPLFDESGALLAVLTVDFDASELAPLLEDQNGARHSALVGPEGALIASHGFRLPAREAWPRDRALRVEDTTEPLLRALLAAGRHIKDRGAHTIEVAGQDYFVDAAPIGHLDGVPIALLSAIEEERLYGRAQDEARLGVLVTGLVALIALGFAFALSANIARLRRARATAERAAAEAWTAADEARRSIDELGSYELVELLGGGAMGEVYRARHKLLSREAALKLIRRVEDADAEHQRQLFFQEARQLARLRSIHTVAVYDFGVATDGRYFLAMELLEGLDLDALVRRFGPQPPGRVAAILAQICDSLGEAHELGLVHQDIKPANVFLCKLADDLDVVKVLDFGIARAVGPLGSRLSRSEGTPAFMSPEQILGEPVSALADLYAVGGVGYYLLTGQLPYPGPDVDAIQLAHVERPIPELPPELSRVTPALAQLITRCLAKRPEHRPVSARALAEALREVAAVTERTFSREAREQFWAELARQPASYPARGPLADTHVRTVSAKVYPAGLPVAARR